VLTHAECGDAEAVVCATAGALFVIRELSAALVALGSFTGENERANLRMRPL
jgi:hypothetical protein